MASIIPSSGRVSVAAPEFRSRLAERLMAGAFNAPPPVRTQGEAVFNGINRFAQMMMAKRLMGEEQERKDAASATMAQALKASKPWIAPDDVEGPNGGIVVREGQPAPGTGGMEGMAAALMGNRDTAPLALQMQMNQIGEETRLAREAAIEAQKYKRNRGDTLEDTKAEREFKERIEKMKADRVLREAFDKMMFEDQLARRRAADDPYLKAGLQPPLQGAPAGAPQPAPQGVQPQPAPQVPGQQGAAPVTGPEALARAEAEIARRKAAATVEGKTQAGAKMDLPRVDAMTNEMLGVLDKIATFDKDGNVVQTHPGLAGMVGMPESVSGVTSRIPFIGGPVPGTEGANFQTVMDQIGGKQFLQAYETLKGGGQITEVEGNKAQAAIARMNTAQSEKAFLEAVREFRGIIQGARERALKNAGQPAVVEEFDYVPGKGLIRRGQ